MTDHIEIESVKSMKALIAAMDEVHDQQDRILQYVRGWVCQKEGFEPTPVCALKPLAPAMDTIDEAFTAAADTFRTRWGELAEAVGRTVQAFERQERETVTSLEVLTTVTRNSDLPIARQAR